MTLGTRIDKERARRARQALEARGISQAQLARELGVSVRIVNEVLRGRLIGVRGATHKVAVAMGLKRGVIVEDGVSALDALRMPE